MPPNEIHKFDSRTKIEVQLLQEDLVPFGLADATLMEFRFQKPSGAFLTRTATWVTDGTDGKVQYVTNDTDLDEVGIWRYQVYIEKGPVEKYSDIGKFRVYPNLPLEL